MYTSYSNQIPIKDESPFGKGLQFSLNSPPIMYSSLFIMQTFLTLLFFQLQDTSTAKDHSGLMRLRALKRSLTDSRLSEAILSSEDNHLTSEELSKSEITTASSSGNILVDESDPGQEQNRQSWLGQDADDTILTLCTTTTDESDQSLLPSVKFQRRQTRVPNACPPEWKTQPGQQKLKLDGQGQGREQTNPDETRPRVIQYPNALELYRLDTFGRAGDPNSICDAFVGQGIPMCAPASLSIPVLPPNVVAPSRFCMCDLCLSRFRFFCFGIIIPPRRK